MDRDHDLAYLLDNLSYHKNDFIAEIAARIKEDLPMREEMEEREG